MSKDIKHIKSLEPIDEKIVSNDLFFYILQKKNIDYSIIDYLKQIINGRDLYDKSGYSGNSVLIVKKNANNSDEFVIKVSKDGNLHDEFVAHNFFYKLGYTSKAINYFKSNGYEIMVTELIDLPTAESYFNSYIDVALFFGKELRKFHDNNMVNKKLNDQENKLFMDKYKRNFEKAMDNDIALIYMKKYMDYDDVDAMKKYLVENKEFLYKNSVIVHGDFNPNNVFIGENMQIKFIDFGDAGICNRHYDIFWTMFMIIIFLGILDDKYSIKKCEKIFYESYGEDIINEKELLFFKYYATLYWKQHDNITRIDLL